jgi:hypothetical protein
VALHWGRRAADAECRVREVGVHAMGNVGENRCLADRGADARTGLRGSHGEEVLARRRGLEKGGRRWPGT